MKSIHYTLIFCLFSILNILFWIFNISKDLQFTFLGAAFGTSICQIFNGIMKPKYDYELSTPTQHIKDSAEHEDKEQE